MQGRTVRTVRYGTVQIQAQVQSDTTSPFHVIFQTIVNRTLPTIRFDLALGRVAQELGVRTIL